MSDLSINSHNNYADNTDLSTTNFECLILAPIDNGVLLVTIHRPKAKNALTTQLLEELVSLFDSIKLNNNIACVVITGGEQVFAAGADIQEMAKLDFMGVINDKRPALWKHIAQFPKPLIAAVNGYALGGGCELAMHADIIVAGETAQFGQPEINLAIIPGAGGTQRLIRAVGKSVAMKMVLSGEFIDAHEAKATGLIAEVVSQDKCIPRAVALAKKIATKPSVAINQAKNVLLQSFETHLDSGLLYERKAFTLLAGTNDRNEGIDAFVNKRKPNYKGC